MNSSMNSSNTSTSSTSTSLISSGSSPSSTRLHAVAVEVAPAPAQLRVGVDPRPRDPNQLRREGHYEAPLVAQQAGKRDAEQPPIASVLTPFDVATTADVAVVGAGPAGLALAAELAKRGLNVALIGACSNSLFTLFTSISMP